MDTDVVKTGSTGTVSFTYDEFVNGTWQSLSEAPTRAGTYCVTANLAGDTNYNGATSQSLEFTIAKTNTKLEFTVDYLDKI